MSTKPLNRICMTMFLLGGLNFMVYCHISQRIGGEAMHGKIEAGRYYLVSGYISSGFPPPLDAPRKYTQVSPHVFRYSEVHGYSVLITFSLGLIACIVAVVYEKTKA